MIVSTVISATDSASICQKLGDVCVPSQDLREGCQCVLTKPEKVDEEKSALLNKFLGSADVDLDDIRYEFLPRKALTALKTFFSPPAGAHELNRNIFKDVSYEVITSAVKYDNIVSC